MVFNQSLVQGIFPENFKVSKVTPIDKGGEDLDFSKAFDTVNHTILLKKMERYGIRGVPLQIFASYLTNRQQYVQMGNSASSK